MTNFALDVAPTPESAAASVFSWVVSTDLLRNRLAALVQARPDMNPRIVAEVLEDRIRFAMIDADANTITGYDGAMTDVDYEVSSASEPPPKPFCFTLDVLSRWLRSNSAGARTEITWDEGRLRFSDPANPDGEVFFDAEVADHYAGFPAAPDKIHTYSSLLFSRDDVALFGKELAAIVKGRDRLRNGYVQVYLGDDAPTNVSFRCPNREILLTTDMDVMTGSCDVSGTPRWVTIPAWFFLGMAIDAAAINEDVFIELEIKDEFMIYRGRTIRIHRASYCQSIVDPVPLIRALGFAPDDSKNAWVVNAPRFVEVLAKYQEVLSHGEGVRVSIGTVPFPRNVLELQFHGRRCGAVEYLPFTGGSPVAEIGGRGVFDLDLLLRCSRRGPWHSESCLALYVSANAKTLRIADVPKPGDPAPLVAYLAAVLDNYGFSLDD